INIMLPPGISVSETSRQLARVRAMLRVLPAVVSVVSKAGRPEDGTDPKMINMAEFLVDVKPPSEWRRGLSNDQLIDQMNTALQTIPGIEPSFSQPIRDNVLESISQIDGQIVVKVFGEEMEVLKRLANDVLRTIAPVRGVARAFVDRAGQVPQLQIEIDRARSARYGLNVADVEDVIETALGRRPASVLLIFVLLFNAFGSVKHAALILVNVPFALIGGILALYVTGIHLSVSAAIGFIALFGQAVLNGVVMVSCFNQLRRSGIGAYQA